MSEFLSTPDDSIVAESNDSISVFIEREDADELVLTLIGQIRFDTAMFVSRPVAERLANRAVARLVLDCHQVVFVDSQALVMLLTLSRACRDQGGELIIRNPLPMVQNLLRVTKLDSLFKIEHREVEASPMARVPLNTFPKVF